MTLFVEVAATSAAVGATRSRTAKLEALAELIGRLDPDEIAATVAILSGGARQGRIGVGWATVADAAGLADATDAAEAEGAIEAAAATQATLTITDIDQLVDRLAAHRGEGSAGARRRELAAVFERATAPEVDLLWRLLTGELRHGALEGLVTEAVARANGVPPAVVRRAAMLAGDLPTVAVVARTGGEAALRAVGLTVMRPVSPMLAATAADVAEAIEATGLASVEWKLDGARIQAHRDGDDVRLFTRNLNDVTGRLPGIVALVRSFPCRQVVLDGEAIGTHESDRTAQGAERPQRFQDTMSQFGAKTGDAGAGLGARFFDVMHLDGVDLLDAPLAKRHAALDRVAGVAAMPRVVTDDPVVAAAFLADALATGHEGVMVKAIDSSYEAGRRGKAWRKVKPVRTLELVVLAAEWGHGRRQGWLSNLHLGARDPVGGYGSEGGFVMVGKTFKGLTDALLTWQTEALQAIEDRRTDGVVWVRPELLVEIALDGVQRSTRYPGGVALRFARVRDYRYDKGPADADTIEAVRAMLV